MHPLKAHLLRTTVYPMTASSVLFVGCALALAGACSPQQTKSAEKAVVRVADDLCQEERATDADVPEWVQLACTVEGVASPVVHVLLPRTEWHSIKARKLALDAGPGK